LVRALGGSRLYHGKNKYKYLVLQMQKLPDRDMMKIFFPAAGKDYLCMNTRHHDRKRQKERILPPVKQGH
jgi:hypothetical protein